MTMNKAEASSSNENPGAVGSLVERGVRREFGALRFSVRRVADGVHLFWVPHQSAVSWFADLCGNGRNYFNDRSPLRAHSGLYVEWPTGPARRVVGWDHEDGWPVVSDGPQHPCVRA